MNYSKHMNEEEEAHISEELKAEFENVFKNYFKDCKKILEIGCGTGWFLQIGKKVGKEVYGIDIDKGLIRICRKRKLNAKLASSAKMPFNANFFDGVFSIVVFEHLDRDELLSTVKEMKRTMKNGAKAMIIVPNIKSNSWAYFDDPTHVTIFTKKSAELLFNDFKELKVEERYYLPKIKGLFRKAKLQKVYDAMIKVLPKKILKPEPMLICTFRK